jgi:membrane-bound ClpP family serine protease
VVDLNTYGGYLAPMDKIMGMLINAKTPVYAYAPHGARAVSASVFIAMAARKIYMASTAQIGAAEPRQKAPRGAEPAPWSVYRGGGSARGLAGAWGVWKRGSGRAGVVLRSLLRCGA